MAAAGYVYLKRGQARLLLYDLRFVRGKEGEFQFRRRPLCCYQRLNIGQEFNVNWKTSLYSIRLEFY